MFLSLTTNDYGRKVIVNMNRALFTSSGFEDGEETHSIIHFDSLTGEPGEVVKFRVRESVDEIEYLLKERE